MRKLLFLGLLVALLVGVDLAARAAAERRLETRAVRAAGQGATASAEIGSFPFLARLLLAGEVPEVSVRAEHVTAGPLTLDAVVLDLDGVSLDRSALYGGEVRLRDIDGGTVTVEFDAVLLADALDVPVEISAGALRVAVAGQPVTARAMVDNGELVVSVAGLPALRLVVPRTELSPCRAAEVTVVGDRLRLSCRIDSVPPGLLP
ncbi:MAG: LmeA family phospholipid-binding protein [Acidimicrobiales bacterium]